MHSKTLLGYLTGLPRAIASFVTERPCPGLPTDVPAYPILGQATSVPQGHVIFAFGDVHGHFDLLSRMLRQIHTEMASASELKAHIIGLGDYIDRGPESAKVLDLLTELSRDKILNFTGLKGNHEDVFLRFLDKPREVGPLWMELGGEETLRSYGLELQKRPAASHFIGIRNELALRLPPAHLSLMLNLRTHLIIGDYFFCHAGVRSGVRLDEQRDQDLMWIRNEYAEGDEPLEKIIIHGHKPVINPVLRPYRVNVDTGAYLTGVLTSAVLKGNRIRTIQVRNSSGAHLDANPRKKNEAPSMSTLDLNE